MEATRASTPHEPTLSYFAYGSNMLRNRLRERVPSAEPIGVARLTGHRLAWHKVSTDGSGKCDIVPGSPGDEVWGVLFEIDPEHKADLDRIEGVGEGYESVRVVLDMDGTPLEAETYRAIAVDSELRPYGWYKALVVAGARENGLTEAYVQTLDGVPAVRDTDAERRRRNSALLASRAL
jgi:gamma-glutamylcyclotransferase (GGCT)/AIG2-like uncharacterized protein YtfP